MFRGFSDPFDAQPSRDNVGDEYKVQAPPQGDTHASDCAAPCHAICRRRQAAAIVGYAIEAIASPLTARSSGVGGKGEVADLPESRMEKLRPCIGQKRSFLRDIFSCILHDQAERRGIPRKIRSWAKEARDIEQSGSRGKGRMDPSTRNSIKSNIRNTYHQYRGEDIASWREMPLRRLTGR